MHEREAAARDGRTAQIPKRRLILVVDDDPLIRDCLASALEDEGYEAITAPHGAAALQWLEQCRQAGAAQVSAIILDMRMPVMDGWAFAEAYRRTPAPHAPIVVITAAHDTDCAAQIEPATVVAKPFDLDELLAIVADYLRSDVDETNRATRENAI